jgi:hypothetical protein
MRKYRHPKYIHQKVFVLTDDTALRIEILLSRGPQYQDEHVMNFNTIEGYRDAEYDIFSTLRDKGYEFFNE